MVIELICIPRKSVCIVVAFSCVEVFAAGLWPSRLITSKAQISTTTLIWPLKGRMCKGVDIYGHQFHLISDMLLLMTDSFSTL